MRQLWNTLKFQNNSIRWMNIKIHLYWFGIQQNTTCDYKFNDLTQQGTSGREFVLRIMPGCSGKYFENISWPKPRNSSCIGSQHAFFTTATFLTVNMRNTLRLGYMDSHTIIVFDPTFLIQCGKRVIALISSSRKLI